MAQKVAHTTPSGQPYINQVAGLGFNAVHTNDTHNQNESQVAAFLNRCQSAGVKGLPRVDSDNPRLTQIINAIKNHSHLLGVISNDEADCEHIPVSTQKAYFNTVRSLAPGIKIYRMYDACGATYKPALGEFNQVCDIVFWVVYPFHVGESSAQAIARIHNGIDAMFAYMRGSPNCVLPVVQAFYGINHRYPSVRYQRDTWANRCAGEKCRMGTAYWLHGAGSGYTGYWENNNLKIQVIESLGVE